MSSFTISSPVHLAKAAYPAQKQSPAAAEQSFSTMLGEMLKNVNDSQRASNQATEQLVTGKTTDLHQAMIAAEKASLTLQTTLEIRNKVVEAYQEVMRTQL
ncbi:flagellar hook-basal body complex protein FliE [Fictibacillus solisalsi]|uniref:Flagellar hook-basal body complex protein FliE n=1 Tax=Fictibacillus solisalsi TaxID=459525 RepID=A0A1G9UXI4_9BACL|nr:flagellar hook-basal body complex protein FliE [Fictibacillus solisalsi]SDM64519.1 flagellar hook-basal body complex protein FliE [Fictibacillus solisalsi]